MMKSKILTQFNNSCMIDSDDDDDDVYQIDNSNNNKGKHSYLNDSDDEIDDEYIDFDALESQGINTSPDKQQQISTYSNSRSSKNPISFQDSDEISDDEMIKLTEEAEKNQLNHTKKQSHFLISDSENDDDDGSGINIKNVRKELGKKTQTKFLDDSDMDIDIDC